MFSATSAEKEDARRVLRLGSLAFLRLFFHHLPTFLDARMSHILGLQPYLR